MPTHIDTPNKVLDEVGIVDGICVDPTRNGLIPIGTLIVGVGSPLIVIADLLDCRASLASKLPSHLTRLDDPDDDLAALTGMPVLLSAHAPVPSARAISFI